MNTIENLIERLKAKDSDIRNYGWGGFMDMVNMWDNPYHFMRLAAESIQTGRANDKCLTETGRADRVEHCVYWLNRAAAFRQRAVDLLKRSS